MSVNNGAQFTPQKNPQKTPQRKTLYAISYNWAASLKIIFSPL